MDKLDIILETYNRVTNPAVLRTDEQHRKNSLVARAALNILARDFRKGIDWTENENTGALKRARA